jgi:ABC-2 type transport system permease protein
MKALMKHLGIQLRVDARDKGTLLVFYIVPLIFYAVMGAVFSSVTPQMKQTLPATMAIFSVTMGAVIGIPPTLVKMREAGVLRAYRVSGVPGACVLLAIGVSALVHLCVVALIICLSAPALFGAQAPPDAMGFAAVLAAVLFSSVALGLLIGVTAKSQAVAMMLSQALFMPSLMLSGIMFPVDLLPQPLMHLGRAFPAAHAMRAFSALAYAQAPDFGAALPLFAVLGMGLAALALAVWRFGKITWVN